MSLHSIDQITLSTLCRIFRLLPRSFISTLNSSIALTTSDRLILLSFISFENTPKNILLEDISGDGFHIRGRMPSQGMDPGNSMSWGMAREMAREMTNLGTVRECWSWDSS
jgi:hypothetical protein